MGKEAYMEYISRILKYNVEHQTDEVPSFMLNQWRKELGLDRAVIEPSTPNEEIGVMQDLVGRYGVMTGRRIKVEYQGRMVTLKELSELVGINESTLYYRYRKNPSIESLLRKPQKRGSFHEFLNQEWEQVSSSAKRSEDNEATFVEERTTTKLPLSSSYADYLIEHDGKVKSIQQVAKDTGLSESMIYRQIARLLYPSKNEVRLSYM